MGHMGPMGHVGPMEPMGSAGFDPSPALLHCSANMDFDTRTRAHVRMAGVGRNKGVNHPMGVLALAGVVQEGAGL